jgi:hypothetical protein
MNKPIIFFFIFIFFIVASVYPILKGLSGFEETQKLMRIKSSAIAVKSSLDHLSDEGSSTTVTLNVPSGCSIVIENDRMDYGCGSRRYTVKLKAIASSRVEITESGSYLLYFSPSGYVVAKK